MTQSGPEWPKYNPEWPKKAQNGTRMTQNGPKMIRTFSAIFLTEKAVPQTFLLLECMIPAQIARVIGVLENFV